jgi:hypothetical protein
VRAALSEYLAFERAHEARFGGSAQLVADTAPLFAGE